ncbi:bacillithiol biosynthesis cysteine-adding enzyme BshC [Bacillus piscicola]|uniref:bacillithiol biosynthesis cysteine-adding enzyme BshC n=1 Tax=Bacillus piscicola TaxID=1632684 RepID=UPI001F0966F3|nr:bacillithiol biosynthesis cysteine-adding enzyme BshC [Bacillus piscicola]
MELVEKYWPHPDKFVRDYMKQKSAALAFFDYGFSQEAKKRRLRDLQERGDSFPRASLYNHLYTYNRQFLHHEKALEELEKLHNPRAVMAVGGQQAGLLTGPFYTISKAITILKEAKKLEVDLQVPVLPVFWIAGEDHDWEEVNHIWLPGENGATKINYKGPYDPGRSISDQVFEKKAFQGWWEEIMELLPETRHTASIDRKVSQLAARAHTVTEFFGEMMRWLFRDTGLIVLDAHHPSIRELEQDTFLHLLKGHREVNETVQKGMDRRRSSAYGLPAGLPQESIHVFYHDAKQRRLLYEKNRSTFTDKSGMAEYDKKDLLAATVRYPECFSANVLTRPLVQEKLLPVLSFIAGPGEIHYWSLLRPLFHQFNVTVPPVVPRISYTLLPRCMEARLEREQLTIEDIISDGGDERKSAILDEARQVDGQQLAENFLQAALPFHDKMREEWGALNPSEAQYGEKNWLIIEREIRKFAKKIDSFQDGKEEQRLQNIQQAAQFLLPRNKPQERVFNVLWFLNEYGSDLAISLCNKIVERELSHHVVKM